MFRYTSRFVAKARIEINHLMVVGPELLFSAVKCLERLIDKTELVLRACLHTFEVRRHERLYGAKTPVPVAPRKGVSGQTEILAGIVQASCQLGDQIIKAHDAAELKLDAAEYALSSLLADLRAGTMSATMDCEPRVRLSEHPSVAPMASDDRRAA